MGYRNMSLEKIVNERGGVLLTGPIGLGQDKDALLLADSILGESHEGHPDFVNATDSDDIVAYILDRLICVPARAERRVVLIDHLELMNITVQNKLLKLFEEADAFFIAVAYGEVIGTIKSRLKEVIYRAPILSEYLENGGTLGDFYAGGISADEDIKNIFSEAEALIRHGERNKLLDLLGLVNEKDKSFYEINKPFTPALFCLIGNIISENGGELEKIRKAAVYAGRCIQPTYCKAEFFSDIVNLL